MNELRDLRWAPMQPKFMDYPNAQFLMIGEAQDKLGKGGLTEGKDPEKEEAAQEIENLEHENEVRAYPLKGMLPIFVGVTPDIRYKNLPGGRRRHCIR